VQVTLTSGRILTRNGYNCWTTRETLDNINRRETKIAPGDGREKKTETISSGPHRCTCTRDGSTKDAEGVGEGDGSDRIHGVVGNNSVASEPPGPSDLFDHDVNGVIVLHVQRLGRILLVDPRPIIQKPDTADVFSDLVRVRALKLGQLRGALDLKVYLFTRSRYDFHIDRLGVTTLWFF